MPGKKGTSKSRRPIESTMYCRHRVRVERHGWPFLACVSALLWISLGCNPPADPIALIHYTQLGACTNAQTGTGAVIVPPSHAVVIFRISTVDNTPTAKNWSFDASTLAVNPAQPQQNLGGTGPVSIAAHTSVAVNAPVGILVETSNADGSDASSTNYFLVYPLIPPAPGTLAVKDNPNQVSYPFKQDCNAIAGR
jgi:hypothetical protein